MKKEGGFTLVEFLVVVALLGVIAAVVILNVDRAFSSVEPPSEAVPAYNVTLADDLFSRPLSSLNVTELQFLADYCMWSSSGEFSYEAMTRWSTRATVYQLQLLLQRDACGGG